MGRRLPPVTEQSIQLVLAIRNQFRELHLFTETEHFNFVNTSWFSFVTLLILDFQVLAYYHFVEMLVSK